MSKKLALTASFAILAMAGFVLSATPSELRGRAGGFAPVQAGALVPDLPKPALPFLN